MKKILSILAVLCILLTASCNEPENEKEPNPYPDGVYPFEVSNVKHFHGEDEIYDILEITWDKPDDKNFTKVQLEIYMYANTEEYPEGVLWYPRFFDSNNLVYTLTKNSFYYSTVIGMPGNKKYAIIKCVDKFGNVSEGVRHDDIHFIIN